MNRTPRADEIDFWNNYYRTNTPEQTLAAFKESARKELGEVLSSGYTSVLNRQPGPEEVNYWVNYALDNGVVQAAAAFNAGARDELAAKGGGTPGVATGNLVSELTGNYPYGSGGGIYKRTPQEEFMYQGELARIPITTTIANPVIPTTTALSPGMARIRASGEMTPEQYYANIREGMTSGKYTKEQQDALLAGAGATAQDVGVAMGNIARPLTFTAPTMPGATAGTTQSIGQFIQSKIPPVTPTKEQAGPVFTPAQVTAQLELERLKAANAPSAVGLARGGDAGSEARRMLLNLGGAPVKKFSDGGSAGESSSDVDLMEEIASGFAGGREPGKAEEAFRALVEGSQGFLGLEPGRKGSEPYRTGQALSNLPALALPAAAIKGTGKAKDALKALGKKETLKKAAPPGALVGPDGEPVVIYRGVVFAGDPTEGMMAGAPRSGYATFGSTSPHVASSYANPDLGLGERGAVTPLFVMADQVIEFPVTVDRYGLRKFDKFEFDRRAQSLKEGQVLVARDVVDYGPRARVDLDPQKMYSYGSDVYAFGPKTKTAPAVGKAKDGEVSTEDFIRKRQAGSPPEGEMSNDEYIQQMMVGTVPQDRQRNPGILPPEIRGAVDVPLDILNLLVRGTVGAPVGSAYGLYKGLTSDKFGTPEGVKEASSEAGEMMARITGEPKTQTARDILEYIGKKAEALKLAPMPQLLTLRAPGPGAASALLRNYELAQTRPEGVIKLPGGNYLAGQVERALNETKTLTAGSAGKTPESVLAEMKATYPPEVVKTLSPESVAQVNRAFADLEPKVALNKWIDSKLTKYVKNDMATERDPLRLQADKWATEQQPKLLAEKDAQIAKAKADMEKAQRERGVEPEVLTRSRARILELEKEREFIAARTGMHYTPRESTGMVNVLLGKDRESAGFPREPFATSPIARNWEALADRYLTPRASAEFVRGPDFFLRETDAQRIKAENPWLSNVPPGTQVQMLNRALSQQDTGFKHMTDELRNALNPDSGLPPSLQISAKDLEKMTVPQAVDLVDRINAHRAVQKIEADKLAAQKSIEVYKEYPETEQGLRWVQIKLLDSGSLPEGFSVSETKVPGTLAVRDADGKQVALGKNEDEAVRNFFKRNPNYLTKNLEEALKYEGDIMQHCVGGYCPDVLSGESRIFSLRDSTGRPHATVEVAPDPIRTWDDVSNVVGPEEAAKLWEEFDATSGSRIKKKDDAFLEFIEEKGLQTPLKIKQIKGVLNKKPEDEYIPFVQDFVKGQRWSSVGDINNTGLIDLRDTDRALNALGTRDLGELRRLKKVFKGDYITPEELSQFRSTPGYAAGGEVTKFIKAHA